MLKSNEIKLDINEKRAELEKFQREERIQEAQNAATELNKMVDALNVQLALEKSDFENFLKEAEPLNKSTGGKNIKGGIAGEEYREKFFNAVRGKFKTSAVNFLRESNRPDGGYLVPSEFHSDIVSSLEEENVMRQIGTVFSTESIHRIPVVASKPTANWLAEGETINFSQETFDSVQLDAFKLGVSIKVSNELLQDSFYPIEEHLTREFALAMGRAEEDAFLTGTTAQGATEKNPTGILPTLATSPTTTITTKETEISVEDLLNLEFSLKRPYRKQAVWLMSDSVLSLVRKMKDAVGRFIWEPNLTETEPARIFGYPVYTSPYMPAMESGNVVALFGDFKDYYLIGERGQRVFKPLREILALSDQTAFLMIERIDAKLTNLEAVKALKLK